MESVLIVSYAEKAIIFFTEMLRPFSCDKIVTASSCAEARQFLFERDFDLVIINAPLRDETGERLSRHIAENGVGQVILVVKSEYYDAVSENAEGYGVIIVAKPINKNLFWSVLNIAKATQNKLKFMRSENNKLLQKIEDIRIVSRAKCILISHLNMSEGEAHKYIEKQSMDKRMSKREVAEGILKTYEN